MAVSGCGEWGTSCASSPSTSCQSVTKETPHHLPPNPNRKRNARKKCHASSSWSSFILAYFFAMGTMLYLISKICWACFLSVSSLSSTTLAAAAASASAFLFLQAITDRRLFSLLAASCGSLKEKVNFFISVHLKRLILIK